jgi:m7GpppX diphosphatase
LNKASSKVQVNFIYPATDQLIEKYTQQKQYVVRETGDMYTNITKPKFVAKRDPKNLEWIQNVLDGTKEAELQIFENEHFKLGKDYKFNEGDLSTLWLLALPKTALTK